MNIVTIRDGAVVAVTTLAANETAVVTEATPRLGSLPNEAGGWSAPSDAVLVDDETGEVVQIARAKWAADRASTIGGTWKDAPANVVDPGMIEQEDGSFAAPVPPRDVPAEIAAHALALKIGAVNATRTDGDTDPVTMDALADIVTRYERYVSRYLVDKDLGVDVSGRAQVVANIRAGQDFFEAVDAAAAAILAAGDAADPVSSDARWPPLPAA